MSSDASVTSREPRTTARDEYAVATPFDRAAVRLVSAIEADGCAAIDSEDYALVLTTLSRFAAGFGLSHVDAEEAAAETLAEIFVRSTDPSTGPVRHPAGFLFWTTRNRVFDRYRRARLREEAELRDENKIRGDEFASRYYSREDDAVVGLLDRAATAAWVEDALRAASAANDGMVVRVVTSWLELAETLGHAPTSREVAPVAAVSHTSVSQALRRVRSYFPQADARTSY